MLLNKRIHVELQAMDCYTHDLVAQLTYSLVCVRSSDGKLKVVFYGHNPIIMSNYCGYHQSGPACFKSTCKMLRFPTIAERLHGMSGNVDSIAHEHKTSQ